MTNLTKKGKTSLKRRKNEKVMNVFLALIAFVLLMMSTTNAQASSFILSAKQPDLTGLYVMMAIGGIAFLFCRKGMPKDVPSFDKDGYLIAEKGGQNV